MPIMLYPVGRGALTPLYAGTAPEATELNGKVGFLPLTSALF